MYITNAVQLLMVRQFKVVLVLVVLRHGEIFVVQVVNASVNLPIFFFAGKSFREVTINLVRWARLQKEFEQNNLLVFYVAFNTLIIRYTSYFLIFRCC